MKKGDLKKYNLPDSPGVYFFKKGEEILYIGKATSLKDRVRSYFSKDLIDTRGPLIHQMVFKAKDLDWQKTDSVLEALILEANLIKKHQPYFNTKEKDDKSFYFVGITGEEYPKVILIRERNLEKSKNKIVFSKTYGPFTNGGQLKEALKIIRKIFPFLDDKSKSYYAFYKQIELAPEIKEKENKSYLKNIKNIKLFFEGKKNSVLKSLEKDMKLYAKNHQFERAGEVKRQIFALKHINDVALIKEENINFANQNFSGAQKESSVHGRKLLVSEEKVFRIEAYDIAHMSGKNMVGVMVVSENGEFEKSEYKKFIVRSQQNANDAGALREVLERRFKHTEWKMPDLVVLDGNIIQINVATKVLEKFGLKIPVVSVVKDDKHKAREILVSHRSDLWEMIERYKKEIIALNAESHRFAINFHKQKRINNFLR